MNCRKVQDALFADGDPGVAVDLMAVNQHVASCPECRRVQASLAAALAAWRTEAASARIPDADREWQEVRRLIRGAGEKPAETLFGLRRQHLAWMTVPLGAAAALTVAFLVLPSSPAPDSRAERAGPQIAHADSVEAPGKGASTMVFVDEKSGWLIVLASDAAPKRG